MAQPTVVQCLLLCAKLIVLVSPVLVAFYQFGTGFFPYKPFLPGLAEFETLEYGPPPEPPFDKLVFMVVDALRSDFVYSEKSGFKYTQSLIRDGKAIPFTANARSPTVTMPRIKSMTTGSIPSFVDLILNIDEGDTSSSLAVQDTWLSQLKAKNTGKLVMYGDDTWLKLFPDTFDRVDGTSSFFVSDYTEVDHNVTRNIAGEMINDDWSLMILHYLGLDHIGHKSGPRSPNMVPKQHEMDGIVQNIYAAIESSPHLSSTLFVMCGDHGMNDAGNHGASSAGETSSALVFMSPKLAALGSTRQAPAVPREGEFDYYATVEQSDLAPTIAALMGFPISKNNLGAFIPDFLSFWEGSSDRVQILVRNARQILNIVTAAFGDDLFDPKSSIDPCDDDSEINELACVWRSIITKAPSVAKAGDLDKEWLAEMADWLHRAQDLMSSMASNYDMPKLFIGLGSAVFAVVVTGIAAYAQGLFSQGSLVPLLLISFSYGGMMFASSYVEEEHHFWYWSSTLWLAFLGTRQVQRSQKFTSASWYLIALLSLRIIRSWNQTGQKYAGNPDIVKTFITPNPLLLWLLIALTYAIVSLAILPNLQGLPYIVITALTSGLISSAVSFKLAFTAEDSPELVTGPVRDLNDAFEGQSLVWKARMVFALVAAMAAFGVWNAVTGPPRAAKSSSLLLHHLYTILALTQSRATNIPVFLLFTILSTIFRSLPPTLTIADISTTSILLQYTSFFALGGSNAISSVDLSSAYNGISGYNIFAVGVLTFVSNWAGPVFWTFATNELLLRKYRSQKAEGSVWLAHVVHLLLFNAVGVAFVMAACTALRTHLFIWTVFSPKFLYCMAWSMGQHLVINIVVGGLLFWLGAQ